MAEFTKQELTLALGHHVAQKLIGADRSLDQSELALLHEIYPLDAMVGAGFVNAESGGYTDGFEVAARQAFNELPAQLDDDQKLAMMRVWWRLSYADGELAASETEVLMKAGQVLGWDLDRIQSAFEQLAVENAE